jgi:hypothetical protein
MGLTTRRHHARKPLSGNAQTHAAPPRAFPPRARAWQGSNRALAAVQQSMQRKSHERGFQSLPVRTTTMGQMSFDKKPDQRLINIGDATPSTLQQK